MKPARFFFAFFFTFP
ncbi:pheA operon leader peptide PheL [Salmonella enterica]|nr:pheA operon leader peptide PheL [Salmonella enterica]EHM1750072.1 pheA operon leader peptide PheL [Salmonella enterica subsp. salamae serovar 40:c:e,n,x,z15]HCM1916102.1 pheA operon leader peptide PheL [Salmonella enterica subsp. salamae serovar 28:r:e,n,z15]HCM1997808.1 pheA operon leader peptide PheL [Salmonella enterica subsp. salamae serovar [1],40:z35:e,n,x,z15]EIC8293712.1 pheA operon leader peptide PheL [Salmonella enterica]EIU8981096.1 pheA operon leader peptide PheL [Salmonella ent